MTLAQKLQLKKGETIRVLNAPKGLELDLPVNRKAEAVLLFVKNVADLNKRAPKMMETLNYDALCWIAYPKKTGALPTDIHRDFGWDVVLMGGLNSVRQISIDETWSALRFRPARM